MQMVKKTIGSNMRRVLFSSALLLVSSLTFAQSNVSGTVKDANWRFPKGQTVGKCGEVSRIYFNNIYATSENGCFIGGDTKDKVRDIYLNNVHLNLKKVTSYDGGVYDKRPCRGEGFIYNKVYGVYVENARDVEIDDLRVQVGPKVNYGGKTFGIDD